MRSFFFKYWYVLVVLISIGSIPALTHADQSVTVSGSVAPQTADVPLTVSNDSITTIPQNTVVTYTINYGSKLLYADTMTIEADWFEGTISGAGSPSVDPMTYVSGSATHAYNNTQPVVDLTHNKITWTISNFPANTQNQTVTFQLLTNTAYTGSNTVTFPVKVFASVTHFTKPAQESDISYQFDASLVTPTPTPTPQPTSTPTPIQPTNTPTPIAGTGTPTPILKPTAIPTPTPTPQQIIPTFSNVSILNLVSNAADIGYIVTKTGTVRFVYGTSPANLGNTQTSNNPGYGAFHIDNLQPQQTYYFQVSLGSETSEIYSFTTPVVSQVPEVVKTSLVIATDNDVLYSAGLQNNTSQDVTAAINKNPVVAVAPNTTYSLSFKITKTQHIQSVQVLLQNANVLGLANTAFAQTLSQYPYIYSAADKGNGVYTANIANSLPPGSYNMFLVVKDAEGNITTQQVASVHVLHPFQALNSKTKQPIEDVRIVLYRLTDGSYSIVSDTGVKNPLYTNRYGTVEEQLLTGKYKATFSSIGYATTAKYFSVGISPTDDYPTAYMSPQPITVLRVFMYYRNAFLDFRSLNASYYDSLRQSYRFLDLVGLVIILCSTILVFLIFSYKTHIQLNHVFWYVHHHSLKMAGKETPYLNGTVIGQNNTFVENARIAIVNAATKQVLKEVTTSKNGAFLFPKKDHMEYLLSVVKEGYVPIEHVVYQPGITIHLTQQQTGVPLLRSPLTIFLDMVTLIFEFVLVLSFVFLIVLFPAFDLVRTIPFLIASIANFFLWFFYLWEKRS